MQLVDHIFCDYHTVIIFHFLTLWFGTEHFFFLTDSKSIKSFSVLNLEVTLASEKNECQATSYPEYVLDANPSTCPMVDQLDRMELWMTFFFLFDYVLYLYAADQRVKHMCQFLQVIDFVTIVPSLLTFIMKSANPDGGKHLRESLEKASQLNFLRFVRLLKLFRILRLLRTMNFRKSDTAAGEVFIFSGK
jgi:hypothetical protein